MRKRPTYQTSALAEASNAFGAPDQFQSFLIERGMSNAQYLLSVEAGAEVFTGAGQLDTTAYAVEIDKVSPIH